VTSGGALNTEPTGNIADAATDSGNPIKVGGVAVETDDTDPTSVTEGQRANFRTDLNRRVLVNTRHPRGFSANENHTTAQTNNELQAAPGAGLHIYITDVTINADTAGNLKLVSNTASPTDRYGPWYYAANGGLTKEFLTPIRLPDNQNLGFTSVASGNHTVSVQGYIAP
jgi:hypothetical protein